MKHRYSYCTIAHFNKVAEVFGAKLLHSGDRLIKLQGNCNQPKLCDLCLQKQGTVENFTFFGTL